MEHQDLKHITYKTIFEDKILNLDSFNHPGGNFIYA